MRIAIVDDVESERKELHQKVSAGLECHAISAEIFEYNSGEPFLTAAKQNKFALVFMDIYMGSENGIDISKKLWSFDKNCLIVLTTTSTEHALEGFRVRAFQYLVKPYTENELSERRNCKQTACTGQVLKCAGCRRNRQNTTVRYFICRAL